MQVQDSNVSFALRSNFHLDFFLAQGGLWYSMEDAWGPVIGKFINELYDHLTVNEKVVELVAEQRYYEACEQWQKVEKRAYFESFRLIAATEKQKLQAKYQQTTKELKQNLEAHYSGELETWRVQGDWKWKNHILSAKNTSSDNFYMIAGENPLEDYVLQFEVKDVQNQFSAVFHWNKNFSSAPNYKAISFSGNKKQQGQWIPLKFKVHKNRISYWYGLKHYVVRSSASSGLFGFYLAPDSRLQIRNLRLTVEKKASAEFEQPVIYIQSKDSTDPVFAKEKTNYTFTVKNEGKKQATGVTLTVSLPKDVNFISASGAKYAIKNDKVIFDPVIIQPNKTLKCVIHTSPQKAGSHLVLAEIEFNELQGKIVVTERTHVIPSEER